MGSGRCEARQMCSKYLHMALALAYGAFDPKKSCIHGSQPTHVLPCMDMVMACLVVCAVQLMRPGVDSAAAAAAAHRGIVRIL